MSTSFQLTLGKLNHVDLSFCFFFFFTFLIYITQRVILEVALVLEVWRGWEQRHLKSPLPDSTCQRSFGRDSEGLAL